MTKSSPLRTSTGSRWCSPARDTSGTGDSLTARIIDGKAIAAQVRKEVAERVARAGVTPGFVDVLIGEDPASKMYVGMKYKAAAECGIVAFDEFLPAHASL